MKKFAAFIVKYRLIILGLILLATIACTFAMFYVNVNSDILSYLPDGMDMTEGLDFMQENFNMQGDAIIGIRGEGLTYEWMQQYTSDLAAKYSVGDDPVIKPGGVIWYGMIKDMASVDDGGMGSMIDGLIKDYGLTFEKLMEIAQSMAENPEIEQMFHPDDQTYLIMLQLSAPSSSDEAMDLLDHIETTVTDAGYDVALGGSSQITRDVFQSTIGEIPKYLVVGILVMFIILLLTTTSLMEPIIFMLTLGVSIMVNMGTNIILPSVSVITFAASALTTVGGFLALFFMKFEIGADLGLVLAKGVALSLLTVIFLQPSLMLLFDKAREKTKHRILVPKFKTTSGFAVTYRKTLVVIALILLIPVAVLQGKVELSYIKFTDENPNPTQVEQVVDSMSNSVIVIVPTDTDGDGVNDYDRQYAFIEDVKGMDHDVTAMMGLFTMIPEDGTGIIDMAIDLNDPDSEFAKKIEDLLKMAEDLGPAMGIDIDEMKGMLDTAKNMIGGFVNNGYTMYTIMIDCEAESAEAEAALADIHAILGDYFGEDYYLTGMSQAVEDLKEITPTDFNIVTIVSVLIILVVLLFTLRSFKMSAIIIAVIEFGIFLNLTLCYIVGQQINFMAYIILSSIQLGATVDYAILFTVKYKNYLGALPARQAAYKGLTESGVSILTSVAILAGCCLSVSLITSNRIVSEITMLIARGAIISGILVLVLLPAILIMFTGNQKLKGARIRKRQRKLFRKETDPDEGKEEINAQQV